MKSTTRIRPRTTTPASSLPLFAVGRSKAPSFSGLLLLLLPALSVAFAPAAHRSVIVVKHSVQQSTRIPTTRLHQTPPSEKKTNKKSSSSSNNNDNSNNDNNNPVAHPNDPRAYRRNRRILRELNEANFKRAKQKVQKRKRDEEQASVAFDLPKQPLVRTIGGGTAMIFAMAQRMFEQQKVTMTEGKVVLSPSAAVPSSASLPRWRPAAGIADENPSFRTSSPNMNNQGYAGVIWRNVRKRDKPSLYRYALRTYDRMTEATPTTNNDPKASLVDDQNSAGAVSELVIQPTNIHHEGALLATAKLGLWERALDIYQRVQEEEAALRKRHGVSNEMSSRQPFSVHVTERMVNSVVRACVRASRDMKKAPTADRREPLDQARAVLEELSDRHDIPLDSHHVNPLAAAYHAMGLRNEAAQVLELFLDERVIGPEPETGGEILNINDLGTKDKASYALLVQGAVRAEDWGAAVENLTTMTEAGCYPRLRHLNTWNEATKTKRRSTRSWKKKRDQSWVLRTVQN